MDLASHRGTAEETPYHPSPPIVPHSASDLTDVMVQHIAAINPASGTEALRALRAAFPDSPLALRVAALDIIMRKRNG